LAPSVTFTENLIKPMLGPHVSDRKMLRAMRIVTVCFTIAVTLYALNSKASIFKMVENAYQVTLVSAFIPLVAGLYWKRATNQGAMLAVLAGLAVWLGVLGFGPEDPLIPAQMAGVIAAFFGMIIGSLAPQRMQHDPNIHHHLRSGAHLREAQHGHRHEGTHSGEGGHGQGAPQTH
jgi:Na+/proline symporter